MGLIAPAYLRVHPSFEEPDIVMTYVQASMAFELLPNGQPRVKLSDGDLGVYLKRLDYRTKMAAGQAAYNSLPNVELIFSYGFTPSYLIRTRAEWDHHDEAAAGRWGIGLQQGYRLAGQAGHFQFMRSALLYGINPAVGEGLVNSTSSTTVVGLPADTAGNTSISTYDNGQMAQLLLTYIQQLKTRTNQIGTGRKIAILAPQRVLGTWEYSVVQLVQYQRAGAGTETTAGMTKLVGEINEDEVLWGPDDTLIGKGSGGTDMIIICMPELEVLNAERINTNRFADLKPGFRDCTAMYCDMIAPREIVTPLPGGAVDMLAEARITSGWPVRPEALTIISATF